MSNYQLNLMITVSTVAIFTIGFTVGAVAGYGVPFVYNKYMKMGKPSTSYRNKKQVKSVEDIFEEVITQTQPEQTVIDAQAVDITEKEPTQNEHSTLRKTDNGIRESKAQIIIDEPPVTAIPFPSTHDGQQTLATAELRTVANSAEDENLKMMLLDRLDEIEEEEADFCQQALCAVLLIDELQQIKSAYTGQNALVIKDMLHALQEELGAHECEVLTSNTWNPEIQKIGKAEYTLPHGATPIITAKLASGLKIKGRIVKKQIIALNKSLS